jgi:uncharacterized protein (DUF433 family)
MEVLRARRYPMALAAELAPARRVYTVAETAYAVEVDDREINREIDAHVLTTVGQSSSGERLIDESGILYMAAIRTIRTDLSKDARLRIAASLRAGHGKVDFGRFELVVSGLAQRLRPRLNEVEKLREAVTIDRAVCGGDPVLRGTRIRVHKVADLCAQGVGAPELRREFDLSTDQVAMALLYARLHPKRGRRETERTERRDLVQHVPARR